MTLEQILSLIAVGWAAAKATGKIDPTIAGYIDVGENATMSALKAIQDAQQGVDPDKLKPIDQIP